MKRRVDKYDENLEKQLDDTNFVYDVGDDLYNENVDKANKVVHVYGSNTLIYEAYGDMIVEECPEQEGVDDTVYNKYIGAEVIMDVPVEGPSQ